MSTIRLGTASPGTQATTAATIQQLEQLARRASQHHIDMLLLPEAYIGGYPRGSAFGSVVGNRSASGRDEFAAYFDSAIDLGDTVGDGAGAGDKWVRRELGDGETLRGDGTREELERIARETGVFLVVGLIEKAGGSLYCAAVYVCPKEGILGKRRKVMPVRPLSNILYPIISITILTHQTGTERLIWAQGSPATLRAISTTIRGTRINLAAAICWESYMPLLRQSLYAQNINLYLAPTADARDAWLGLMRTVGVEGRCFVVSSNMSVRGETSERPATSEKRARRSSVMIEDGSEIALPKAKEFTRRRSSVRIGDGSEIVLPRTDPPRRRRRKSVFDEDGHEIVLGCSDDEAVVEANSSETLTSPRQQLADKTANGHTKGAASWTCRGGSCIVGPFGDVLAGPQWEDDEGLIFADVDFRDCIKGRLDMDAGGSYSRNDAFKLSVVGLDLDPLPY